MHIISIPSNAVYNSEICTMGFLRALRAIAATSRNICSESFHQVNQIVRRHRMIYAQVMSFLVTIIQSTCV